MVVLAIVGLIMGIGVRGFRSLAKSDLRASSAKVSGAVRYLFDRASTTGKNHRLVIDLNEGKYWAEVSDDKFYIPHEAESEMDRRRREEAEAQADEEQKRKDEQQQAAAAQGLSPMSSYDPSKLEMGDFRPKRVRFAAFKETALKPVTLPKDVKIRSVYTPRLTEPVTAGRAYIYFFPMGQTEPSIITLSDATGDSFFSLVVHPITGRVRLYAEEIKPPVGQQYDDEGNRIIQQ
jgi:general secretion pathway protein H